MRSLALPASDEELVINAVMAAAKNAFTPLGEREPTVNEVVKTCAAVVAFLDGASLLDKTTLELRVAVEQLKLGLGPA